MSSIQSRLCAGTQGAVMGVLLLFKFTVLCMHACMFVLHRCLSQQPNHEMEGLHSYWEAGLGSQKHVWIHKRCDLLSYTFTGLDVSAISLPFSLHADLFQTAFMITQQVLTGGVT